MHFIKITLDSVTGLIDSQTKWTCSSANKQTARLHRTSRCWYIGIRSSIRSYKRHKFGDVHLPALNTDLQMQQLNRHCGGALL